MALGAIVGGIAASPFRAVGGIAKGTAKLGYAGLKGLAISAADVSGAAPLFAAALGIKKGITAGYKKGKDLLRPWGAEPGAVTEDSAIKAIAAAASETAKIQAETDKIEAETRALTGEKKAEAVAKTTMGGVDVEILEKIYGEVVSIRGILGDKDPESEKKELALDEQTRHKRFLKALAALGFDGGKGDKGWEMPDWLSNLLPIFKGILAGILAGLGLVALAKYWPQIVKMIDLIKDAFTNINEFITDLQKFWETMEMSWAALLGNILGIRAAFSLKAGLNRARTKLPKPKVIPVDEKSRRAKFLEWIKTQKEAFTKWINDRYKSFRTFKNGLMVDFRAWVDTRRANLGVRYADFIKSLQQRYRYRVIALEGMAERLGARFIGEITTRIDAAKESFKTSLNDMKSRSNNFRIFAEGVTQRYTALRDAAVERLSGMTESFRLIRDGALSRLGVVRDAAIERLNGLSEALKKSYQTSIAALEKTGARLLLDMQTRWTQFTIEMKELRTRASNQFKGFSENLAKARSFVTEQIGKALEPIRGAIETLRGRFNALRVWIGKGFTALGFGKGGLPPPIEKIKAPPKVVKGYTGVSPVESTTKSGLKVTNISAGGTKASRAALLAEAAISENMRSQRDAGRATQLNLKKGPGTSTSASKARSIHRTSSMNRIKAAKFTQFAKDKLKIDAQGWGANLVKTIVGKGIKFTGGVLTVAAVLALAWDIWMANKAWGKSADIAGRGPKQGASILWDAFGKDAEDKTYKNRLGSIATKFGVGFTTAVMGSILGMAAGLPFAPFTLGLSVPLFGLFGGILGGLLGHGWGTELARYMGWEGNMIDPDASLRAQEKFRHYAAGTGGQVLRQQELKNVSAADVTAKAMGWDTGPTLDTVLAEMDAKRAKDADTLLAKQDQSEGKTIGQTMGDWFFGKEAHAADTPDRQNNQQAPTTTKAATAILKGGLSTPPMEDFSKRGAEHDERGMKGWYANEAREQLRRLQTKPETIGTTLTALGKNAGVENFDTVQYNISNNNNSASTSVNSKADTTNIITFDRTKSAPMMRRRHGY